MTYFQVLILGITEGVTEFLPISSTGHMILVQHVLGIQSSEFVRAFLVAIQLGAILSVVVLYFQKFFQSFDFYFKLFVAFLPAAVIGVLFGKIIDLFLDSVLMVGISLFAGGICLLFVDQWFSHFKEKQIVSYRQSFFIGLFQIFSLIPGISRSAATIVGGMANGLTRKNAAEFSFFLAVPTMLGATVYKLYKTAGVFASDHVPLLLFGNVVAFIVALLAIKTFITFLTKHGFRGFGWYRIVVGLVVLGIVFIKL